LLVSELLLVSGLGAELVLGLAEAALLGLAELASGIPEEAWLVLHVSEIIFTDFTVSEELSLPRVPCTST